MVLGFTGVGCLGSHTLRFVSRFPAPRQPNPVCYLDILKKNVLTKSDGNFVRLPDAEELG